MYQKSLLIGSNVGLRLQKTYMLDMLTTHVFQVQIWMHKSVSNLQMF